MYTTDAAVIGAGILGCFAARALVEYDIHVTVLEAQDDVCSKITKANMGIIYTGCDNRPGSVKAKMTVQANRTFEQLCSELDVRFSRCGSLMTAFGPKAEAVLQKKLHTGMQNGVPGLQLLTKDEVLCMEPHLSPRVTAGLYAPGTGAVNPWELGIAAFENAAENGADFHFCEELLRMERSGNGFVLETEKETYKAKTVINCAGLSSAVVREMLEVPAIRIFPSNADFIVLDDTLKGFLSHVIFHETEEAGKGLTLVPTVDGNILLGSSKRGGKSTARLQHTPSVKNATSIEGLKAIWELCAQVMPDLPLTECIRSFSALRPEPYCVTKTDGLWVPADRSLHDFPIYEENGLISLVGIKTPGLTCAAQLGTACAAFAAAYLGNPGLNPGFDPRRKAIPLVHELDETSRAALVEKDPDFGEIVCQCRDITLGEVREAIRRGAVSPDGVKRRTGAGMGYCQGGRCMSRILDLIDLSGKEPQDSEKRSRPLEL